MRRFILVCLLLVGLFVAPALTQVAVIQDYSSSPTTLYYLHRIDPVNQTSTTLTIVSDPNIRGYCFHHDGGLYVGWRTLNGIGRYDISSNTWTTVVIDPANRILGSPLVPTVNNEAIGGPGLWVMDVNTVSTSPTTVQNTALIDLNNKTFAVNQYVPNGIAKPESDGYADPHNSGHFIGVGQTVDLTVTRWALQTSPTTLAPAVICTLAQPCIRDALIHEDRYLYTWIANPTLRGFMQVDLNTGTQKTIQLNIPNPGSVYAGVWNEPWEAPGRVAYICFNGDDKVYKTDLAAASPTAISIISMPVGSYRTAREIEEAQLTSWTQVKTPTDRNFHLNFGKAHAGKLYVLAPSFLGYAASPIVFPPKGLELWLAPDLFTSLAVSGILGYASQGMLDSNGEKDVYFNIGTRVGLDFVWVAVVMDATGVVDISNLIMVCI